MPAFHDDIQRLVYRRELGLRSAVGSRDHIKSHLYSSIQTTASWNPKETTSDTHHGSIFNFDFSSDGSLMVAACERRSVLMFDPHNARLLAVKNNAHADCVNCVRFLDSRTFATCSDDTTVCLWDARYLKNKIRTLEGHSNWVKNIDYAQDLGLLTTSGFDGCIYTWDINSYSAEDQTRCWRIFHTNGLMRSKLTPDASKLIIATSEGYLMVVHDLDLTRLPDDLAGFKPNMYRLMQLGWAKPQLGYLFDHLFTRKRNRVELISDFPSEDNAELISSLEVHPQGWSVCSRNTTNDENSEWTCVHDIQGTLDDVLKEEKDRRASVSGVDKDSSGPSSLGDGAGQSTSSLQSPSPDSTSVSSNRASVSHSSHRQGSVPRQVLWSMLPSFSGASTVLDESSFSSCTSSSSSSEDNSTEESSADEHDTEGAEGQDQTQATNSSEGRPSSSSESSDDTDDLFSPVTGDLRQRGGASVGRLSPDTAVQLSVQVDTNPRPRHLRPLPSTPLSVPTTPGPWRLAEQLLFFKKVNSPFPSSLAPKEYVVRPNIPRLTHYSQEPNVGRGFIKELCFSPDGRLLCSPFAYGLRLLSFSPSCQEMCDCVPEPQSPRQLHEVACNVSHSREVVTVKFSPTHCLLVSGCLEGKVDFHQPVL